MDTLNNVENVENVNNKGYRIKYHDKWIEIIRMLGRYHYVLHDDYRELDVMTKKAAMAGVSLVCEDNEELNYDEIELVKFDEPVKPRPNRVREYIEKYMK